MILEHLTFDVLIDADGDFYVLAVREKLKYMA